MRAIRRSMQFHQWRGKVILDTLSKIDRILHYYPYMLQIDDHRDPPTAQTWCLENLDRAGYRYDINASGHRHSLIIFTKSNYRWACDEKRMFFFRYEKDAALFRMNFC